MRLGDNIGEDGVQVAIRHDGCTQEVLEKINANLWQANSKDRYDLTVSMFRLWCTREPEEKARKIFGEKIFNDGLMLTLTEDGKELRVWRGLPAKIGPRHVDSCGANLVIAVWGESCSVERYLKGFREIATHLREIKTSKNVRLYMHSAA